MYYNMLCKLMRNYVRFISMTQVSAEPLVQVKYIWLIMQLYCFADNSCVACLAWLIREQPLPLPWLLKIQKLRYVLIGVCFCFSVFSVSHCWPCATMLLSTSCGQQPPWVPLHWLMADTCTNCSTEEVDVAEASDADGSPAFSCLPSPLEHFPEASESCFIQFESCPMEESWFITPPPCFTAGGLTTIKVETSPMENLLIEHPSMSVYAVHNTCHSLNEAGCGDEEFHSPGSPRYVQLHLQGALLLKISGFYLISLDT